MGKQGGAEGAVKGGRAFHQWFFISTVLFFFLRKNQSTEMLVDGKCYINANFIHFSLLSAGA